MRNKVGRKLTKKLLKDMWEEVKYDAFIGRGSDPLDNKAHDVYCIYVRLGSFLRALYYWYTTEPYYWH